MTDKILALNSDSLLNPTRRKLLAGGGALGLAGFLGGGVSLPAFAQVTSAPTNSPLLGFTGIPASTADEIAIAPGYRAEVLISGRAAGRRCAALRSAGQQQCGRSGKTVWRQ